MQHDKREAMIDSILFKPIVLSFGLDSQDSKTILQFCVNRKLNIVKLKDKDTIFLSSKSKFLKFNFQDDRITLVNKKNTTNFFCNLYLTTLPLEAPRTQSYVLGLPIKSITINKTELISILTKISEI